MKTLQSAERQGEHLQTELFQVCSCLGNLHAVEPGLQPELLNHLLQAVMLEEPDMALGTAGPTHQSEQGPAGPLLSFFWLKLSICVGGGV